MVFISPFYVRFNSVPYQTKFSKKCPRSCRSCGNLDSGSDWVFADFHGIQIISSKKPPVIQNILIRTIRRNSQKQGRPGPVGASCRLGQSLNCLHFQPDVNQIDIIDVQRHYLLVRWDSSCSDGRPVFKWQKCVFRYQK